MVPYIFVIFSQILTKSLDIKFQMVRESTLATRNQAVGMLKVGLTQKSFARQLGTTIRTVRRWWCRAKSGNSLENLKGRGRKTAIVKVAKIVIAKTLCKKQKSTRKISQILKNKGFPVSHMTVHSYLRKILE